MAKDRAKPQSHLVVSSLVTLVAIIGLVLVFATNQPTGAFVSLKGSPAKGWITKEYRSCEEPSNPQCHKDICRHTPLDPNYKQCGKCPAGSAANPSDYTGNCCIDNLRQQAYCETYRDFFAWKRVRPQLTSPTQQGVVFG